jgi:hypothetical protein
MFLKANFTAKSKQIAPCFRYLFPYANMQCACTVRTQKERERKALRGRRRRMRGEGGAFQVPCM